MVLVRWFAMFLCFAICAELGTSRVSASEIGDRFRDWNSKALMCGLPPLGSGFPSKQTGEASQPCDDGDMTLFNGLLCAAGDARGCQGVADAQDPDSGQWHRSPRIRRIGNDRGGAQFSPDMALGVELYLVTTKDVPRAQLWLNWLEHIVPCEVQIGDTCLAKSLIPRFCMDDQDDKGCTMRPGDAAMLSQTVTYLQSNAGLATLPDNRIRGYLGTFGSLAIALNEIAARYNEPGYSQHLSGVEILLFRKMGIADDRVSNSARELHLRNPGNAFFSILAGSDHSVVEIEILNRCPKVGLDTEQPRNQWQWERQASEAAWKNSSYWDCIFAVELQKKLDAR